MREMKDSGYDWLGKIPSNWDLRRGRYLFAQRNEKGNGLCLQLLSPSQKLGVIPQKLLEELTTHKAVKLKEETDLSELKTVHVGDFCISLRSFQGGFEYSKYEGVVSPAYQIFYATDEISNDYYRYLFKDASFIDKMKSYTMSLRDGKNIAFFDFANTFLPVPGLDEQKHIASYLDSECSKIDTIIEKQQTVIEKLKEYKLSLITETVTKGLNPDVPMKDSGVEWIGEVPEHWLIIRLKQASKIMRGKFNHRPRNDPRYYDGRYPFVQTGDVAKAKKYILNYSQSLNDLGYSVSKEFPKGSICMTIAANVGDVAILNFNACFPDSVVGFFPKNGIELVYLYYALKAMKQQFLKNAIISTQMNLNIDIIQEEYVTVAPLHEQRKIADFLDRKCSAIDATISKKQALIEKLKAYKKSLIYEVVTGKKEV